MRWLAYIDGEFVIGAAISIVVIAIQALTNVLVIKLGRYSSRRMPLPRRKIAVLLLVMGVAGTLLTAAVIVQVAVWAAAYDVLDVIQPKDAFYFAFVNFTTLGYGDLLPAARWRVLGPMTAANGMLMFGWSTAILFAVLSRTLRILRFD